MLYFNKIDEKCDVYCILGNVEQNELRGVQRIGLFGLEKVGAQKVPIPQKVTQGLQNLAWENVNNKVSYGAANLVSPFAGQENGISFEPLGNEHDQKDANSDYTCLGQLVWDRLLIVL